MPNQWCQSSKDTMLNITNCSKQQWLSTEGTRLLPSKPGFISISGFFSSNENENEGKMITKQKQ